MGQRLLFVVAEDWYFLSHRLPLALAAMKAGYEVALACRVNQGLKTLESYGIRVFPLDIRRGSLNPFNDLKTLWQLRKIYQSFQPQVVHHVALKPVLYGSLWAKFYGVQKIINAIAGLGVVFTHPGWKYRVLRAFIQGLMRPLLYQTHIIVQIQEDQEILQSFLKSPQITLIPGAGVNTDMFVPRLRKEHPFRFIMVSRLLWRKGVREYIEAAAYLKKQGHHFEAWLVGTPDLENPDHVPETFLKEAVAQGTIQWLGQRGDVAELYGQVDVAVFPSYYGEGIPKTLLEAASAGKPIITTNHPGCRDVVADDVTGLLVAPQDTSALARAMSQLLLAPERCQTLGASGREKVLAQYDETRITQATLDLYHLDVF